jgi:hypothetical protein
MPDRHRDPRLVGETAPEALVAGEVGRDHLQRQDVVERQMGRPVDDPHSSPPGNALDPVSGKDRARS